MKTVLLIFLLIPIATFIGLVFADIISNLKRSNDKSKSNVRTIRSDYKYNNQSNYSKGNKNNGKVVKMKYRAIK